MKLHFEPVEKSNRREVLKLHTAPGQEGFVESVEECLQEAEEFDNWRPVGIYRDDTLLGFAMYGFFEEYPPKGRVWLDRLMIDERYQGKGYGHEALHGLIGQIREEYGCDEIYLSVVKENRQAARMYENAGFCFINEKDIHGEDVMVLRQKAGCGS